MKTSSDIAGVLHIITGLNDGGAEAVLYRLCTHDRAARHHVVSLMDGGKYGPLLERAGVPVTCLGMRRGRVGPRGLWRLWRLIRTVRPGAIQTWMYHANLVGGVTARLAGQRKPIWGIHHSDLGNDGTSRRTVAVAKLGALIEPLVARKTVYCAERAARVHEGIGYDAARARVIPNGYDLTKFRPDPESGLRLRKETGIPGGAAVIGFVARFDPLKDHETLLRALAVLQAQGDCPHCLLVGTGLEAGNTALTERIAALGLEGRVHLLGRRDDIPAVMNALDLHVMSSLSEAFPNVLAEAMACGTPCVSTDVGDAAAIVGDTGRIVPPRDPDALARAIADLLAERDRPAWNDRREGARRHVADNYSIERMVESYRSTWFDDGPAAA